MDPFSIFRDERGAISISRVQAVGVVAILLVGQVVSLWQTGKLAPIDPSLLGLLGISSGTYLGAKAVVRGREVRSDQPDGAQSGAGQTTAGPPQDSPPPTRG